MLGMIRSRLGFPGIVALPALFVALGGASFAEPVRDAARKLVNGKQIKRGTIEVRHLSPKARRSLRGRRGPAGALGPTGPAGPAGPAGGERGEGGARTPR